MFWFNKIIHLLARYLFLFVYICKHVDKHAYSKTD